METPSCGRRWVRRSVGQLLAALEPSRCNADIRKILTQGVGHLRLSITSGMRNASSATVLVKGGAQVGAEGVVHMDSHDAPLFQLIRKRLADTVPEEEW